MNLKSFVYCIAVYAIFPFSSVLMKLASSNQSLYYKLMLYAGSLCVLFIFSLFWQRILKKTPLIQAYIFKSTTMIWSLLYGFLIFKEKIEFNMIIGIIISTIGIFIIISKESIDEKH